MNKTKLLLTTLGVVLVAGLIWIIATAPKTQAPEGAPAPAATGETAPAASPAQTPIGGMVSGGTAKTISLFLVSPKGGERWLIGENHIISWTSPAQITGEVTLIQSETKKVVGWINSTTGANQTSFDWDARYVSITRNGVIRQEVAPGNYLVRIKFDNAVDPVLTSGIVTITTIAAPVETKNITIQNYAFSPANTTINRGGKVTFTNNDGMAHNITFQSSVYPVSPLAPGQSATIDTTGFPLGTYNYYCSIHPLMKGILVVQ